MQDLEKVLKAVADRNRLRILKLLEYRRMCVCELAYVLGIRQPSVSRHLKKLKDAGLIDHEPEGLWTNYVLSRNGSPPAGEILGRLRTWLNDDEVISEDRAKADRADRTSLCSSG